MTDIDAVANGSRQRVPAELREVLDPGYLREALAPASGGSAVLDVTTVDTLETMAAKVRFAVRFADAPDEARHFCLKAYLGDKASKLGRTAVREADFYGRIAPHLTLRTPRSISVIDREAGRALLFMDDLIHAGAKFYSALEPLDPDDVRDTLDQVARLHAGSPLLGDNPWIPSRLEYIVNNFHFSAEKLQRNLDDSRCDGLDATTKDATLMLRAMERLYERFRDRETSMLHGDCHAGNWYLTADGPGLADWQTIQRGVWADDVAYHIAACLPADVAAREERALLSHYIERARAHGCAIEDDAQAWEDYRAAQVYGFYHWAITTKTDFRITKPFCQRLGAGVARHGTYRLLGLLG